ncbi:MAG: V-type ATP synthase subunit F [Thermodesulfovibrionales bacterium]
MKKIAFITPKDAEFGFGLAGMSQYVAAEEDAEDTMAKIISDPDTGLVIIDERIIRRIDDEKMRETEGRWRGILLVLPSPEKKPSEVEDYAARLIRRAIGYHVRLQL